MLQEAVNIELGGKTRQLRYDFNALVALEDELKISVMDLGALLSGAVKLKDLRAILWAGLIHADQSLTPVDVGKMINGVSEMAALGAAVKQAMEAAFPPVEKKIGPKLRVPKNR
jgi:hypothetical protein